MQGAGASFYFHEKLASYLFSIISNIEYVYQVGINCGSKRDSNAYHALHQPKGQDKTHTT